MKKPQILLNKSVHMGLSILELRKTVMHEYWHDYVKPKYEKKKKKKICYMDTDSFTEYIQIDQIYKDIAEDAKKGLKLQIMSWKGHNQKLIRVMKIELG